MSNSRWSIAGQGAVAACQIVQLLVLARLLSSSDFGVGAVFLVTVAIGQMAWDFGSSVAVIQRQEVTQDQLSTLHMLNIGLAALFSVLVWIAAPALATALDQVDAIPVLRCAAAVPVIAALGGQFRALHLKHMNFRDIALIDAAAAVTSCSAAVLAATQGWGAYAFAWASIAGAAVNTLLLAMSGRGFRTHGPRWRPRDLAHFMRFGSFQSGSAFISFAYMNLDIVILGVLLNATELGKYSLAKQLCVRPLELLHPILLRAILPQLARLQADQTAMTKRFLEVFRAFNALYLPVFAVTFVTAPHLIPFILGPQWRDIALLFQILSVAYMLRWLMAPSSISLMATGRVARGFCWDLASISLLALVVAAFRPQVAMEMAWILLGVFAAILLPHWFVIVRPNLHLRLSHWTFGFARALALSVLAMGATYWGSRPAGSPAITLLATFLGGSLLYVALSLWLNKPAMRTIGALPPVESGHPA